MDIIFNDEGKINIYKQIQYDLLELKSNSNEEEIDHLINRIPQNYLKEKDHLMIICQLFAFYAQNNLQRNKGNAIKLFEKTIETLKIHLQDESTFLWNIFGGLSYFKLWMHEEGLISIEKIIQSTRPPNSQKSTDYFLPEIIEKEPDIFEKEIKLKIVTPYSREYINEFKEKRRKHFLWLRNSNDYHDPSYREIEKDQLRLS